MENYLSELNAVAEKVITTRGHHLDELYAKIIEGKAKAYEFIKVEPSINHIDRTKLDYTNRLLFENYAYLIELKNENPESQNFFTNIEGDVKRILRALYRSENEELYFGKVESKQAIFYVFTDSVIDFIIDKAVNYHLESLWYQQKINAKNFIAVWLKFFPEKNIIAEYENNKAYTAKIIGVGRTGMTDDTNAILIKHLETEMGLEAVREDKFCDVNFYAPRRFQGVLSMQYRKDERQDVLATNSITRFCQCMISLEHENNYLLCYNEMLNLTQRRARLKVLVTYFDEDTVINTRAIFTALCENFSSIIKQSNWIFYENQQSEYLLIVGSKMKDKQSVIDNRFVWSIQAFNWAGQWTEKHSGL
jgi:hypothetical protein